MINLQPHGSRLTRLDAALAAAACAAGAMAGSAAQAAIVWSGPVNITIPSTTAGVYLNVLSGVFNSNPALVPGWDINPWGSTGLNFFNPSAPSGGVYVMSGTTVANLGIGAIIGPGQTYGSGAANTTTAPFNLNSSLNHVGFRFQNEANGNAIHYGYFRLALGSSLTAQPRTIVEYFYESTANTAIQIVPPTPGTAMGVAMAAAGMGLRRRRVA